MHLLFISTLIDSIYITNYRCSPFIFLILFFRLSNGVKISSIYLSWLLEDKKLIGGSGFLFTGVQILTYILRLLICYRIHFRYILSLFATLYFVLWECSKNAILVLSFKLLSDTLLSLNCLFVICLMGLIGKGDSFPVNALSLCISLLLSLMSCSDLLHLNAFRLILL